MFNIGDRVKCYPKGERTREPHLGVVVDILGHLITVDPRYFGYGAIDQKHWYREYLDIAGEDEKFMEMFL